MSDRKILDPAVPEALLQIAELATNLLQSEALARVIASGLDTESELACTLAKIATSAAHYARVAS